MEKGDKGSTMIRMGVSGWMFLLVPTYPGCPRSKAVKRSLLLLLLLSYFHAIVVEVCENKSFDYCILDLNMTLPAAYASEACRPSCNLTSWIMYHELWDSFDACDVPSCGIWAGLRPPDLPLGSSQVDHNVISKGWRCIAIPATSRNASENHADSRLKYHENILMLQPL